MQARVRDMLEVGEILAQLAEECGELAQAALKLRRTLGTKNPARITTDEAVKKFNEEWADVMVCIGELPVCVDEELVVRIIDYKRRRWAESISRLS